MTALRADTELSSNFCGNPHGYIAFAAGENTRNKPLRAKGGLGDMTLRKRLPLAAAALLAPVLALAGCGGGPNGQGPQPMGTESGHEIPAPDAPLSVEERLEQLAKSIPDVRDAKCVIVGNTAVVGIDVSGELDRSRVGTIKFAVAEALRNDPDGMNAVVTADIDLYHRLQEIREDIAEGRAAEGIAEELADIVGRMMPQLPKDIEPRQRMQEPKAATEESGAQRSGSMNNRPGGERAPEEPQDNRDFTQLPDSQGK